MNIVLKAAVGIVGFLTILLGIGWLGLQVKPKPFPAYPDQPSSIPTIDLPTGLPAPVLRYYKAIMGEQAPLLETAVISGRGRLRIKGIIFPARFRFTHIAGQGYRHYIETTWFGFPLMKVNEWYLDGKARMELPMGVIENEPKIDSAANLSLWGEAVWLPSIFITDPRVRWEAVGENTARLIVPYGDSEDAFTVTFDPETGLLLKLEAMRWKEPTSQAKILWRNEPLGWQRFHGILVPSPAATTWEDEDAPWAVWTIEDIVYNVNITEYIQARGK